MKSKFLIVEDEVFISEHLKQLIQQSGNTVTDICSNKNAVEISIKHSPPDFAFLDIRLLGEETGIDIGSKLKTLGIPFIYISSFTDKETIQGAVDTRPLGYIVKPFSNEEILSAIQLFQKEQRKFITIKRGQENVILPIKEIQFVQSDNVYVEVHLKNERHLVRAKLNEILDQIKDGDFIRSPSILCRST